jgi:hypothetical protein
MQFGRHGRKPAFSIINGQPDFNGFQPFWATCRTLPGGTPNIRLNALLKAASD